MPGEEKPTPSLRSEDVPRLWALFALAVTSWFDVKKWQLFGLSIRELNEELALLQSSGSSSSHDGLNLLESDIYPLTLFRNSEDPPED